MPSTTNTPTYDRRVLDQYLSILNESIRRLEKHAVLTRVEFLKDADVIDAAQNRLRLAIESCADISRHLIARLAWGKPQSYNQTFATLAARGVLPTKWKTAGKSLAWLRNRLIHAYPLITDEVTYKQVHQQLPRLREFIANVNEFIRKHEAERKERTK